MGEWFSQGAALQTELPQHEQALSRTGRILSQVDNPAVDDFLRGARESTEKQQQRAQAAAAAAAATAGKTAADAAKASRRADAPLPFWLKRLAFLGGVVGALVLYGLLAHHVSVAVASGVLWLGLTIPSAIYLRAIWTMGGTDGWGKLVAIVLSGAAIVAPFCGHTRRVHGLQADGERAGAPQGDPLLDRRDRGHRVQCAGAVVVLVTAGSARPQRHRDWAYSAGRPTALG